MNARIDYQDSALFDIMPLAVRRLPVYKGLPVPFTVQWFKWGPSRSEPVPDFKVIDPDKVKRCLVETLCGLCGDPIDGTVTFIGGERSIRNRLFTDPAMHDECARYAMQVCPFLVGKKGYATVPEDGSIKGIKVKHDDLVSTERPDLFGLLHTDGFELVRLRLPDGRIDGPYIHANEGKVEWL